MAGMMGDPEIHHGAIIFKKRFNGERRRHYYSQSVVDLWNGLLKRVVEAKSTFTFKKRYI